MQLTIPARALALGVVIVPASMVLGSALGSWPLPVILALVHGGWRGVSEIPVEWWFANFPPWLDPKEDRFWYPLAILVDGAIMVAGAGVLGLMGGRLWGYLVVKRFGWMTKEEVQEFSKRDPGI